MAVSSDTGNIDVQLNIISNMKDLEAQVTASVTQIEAFNTKLQSINTLGDSMRQALSAANGEEQLFLAKKMKSLQLNAESLQQELAVAKLLNGVYTNNLSVLQQTEKVQNLRAGSFNLSGYGGAPTSSAASEAASKRTEQMLLDKKAEQIKAEKDLLDQQVAAQKAEEARITKRLSERKAFEDKYTKSPEQVKYDNNQAELNRLLAQGTINRAEHTAALKREQDLLTAYALASKTHNHDQLSGLALTNKERKEGIRIVGEEKVQLKGLALQWHDLTNAMNPTEGGSTFGHKLGTTAQYMAAGMGLMAITAGFSNAVAAIGEADKALGMFRGVLEMNKVEAQALGNAVYEIGTRYGGTIASLNETALALGRAGIANEKLAQGIKAVSQLSLISGESMDTVTGVLVSWETLYKNAGYDLTRLGDIIVKVANESKASVADFSTMSTYILTAGSQAGMTAEGLASLAGAMKQIGKGSSTTGTELRRFFNQLSTGSDDVRKAYDNLGLDLDKIRTSLAKGGETANATMVELFRRLKGVGKKEGEAAIAHIEEVLDKATLQSLLAIAQSGEKGLNEFKRILETVQKDAEGSADKGASKIALTYQVAWERIKNIMSSGLADLNTSASKVLFDSKNVDEFNESLAGLQVLLSKVFSVLGTTVGYVIKYFDDAVIALVTYKGVLLVAATASKVYATATTGIAIATALLAKTQLVLNNVMKVNPVIAFATALATIGVAAWNLYENRMREVAEEQRKILEGIDKVNAQRDIYQKKPTTQLANAKQLLEAQEKGIALRKTALELGIKEKKLTQVQIDAQTKQIEGMEKGRNATLLQVKELSKQINTSKAGGGGPKVDLGNGTSTKGEKSAFEDVVAKKMAEIKLLDAELKDKDGNLLEAHKGKIKLLQEEAALYKEEADKKHSEDKDNKYYDRKARESAIALATAQTEQEVHTALNKIDTDRIDKLKKFYEDTSYYTEAKTQEKTLQIAKEELEVDTKRLASKLKQAEKSGNLNEIEDAKKNISKNELDIQKASLDILKNQNLATEKQRSLQIDILKARQTLKNGPLNETQTLEAAALAAETEYLRVQGLYTSGKATLADYQTAELGYLNSKIAVTARWDSFVVGMMDSTTQLQQVAQNAFSNMTDSLVELTLTGKASFGDFVNAIMKDLLKMTIQMTVTANLAKALGNAFGFGPITYEANTGTAQTYNTNAYSQQTSMLAAQDAGLYDWTGGISNGNAMQRFASGYIAGGGYAASDSKQNDVIPAMISKGEAVIPASVVNENRALIEQLIASKRSRTKFADGFINSAGSTSTKNLENVKVEIINNTKEDIQASNVQMSQSEQSGMIISIVVDDIRRGGAVAQAIRS